MQRVPGFSTIARRHGKKVILPDGRETYSLFDESTQAESETDYKSQQLAGDPSVVLEERLAIGDPLTVGDTAYEVRDLKADPDGALMRHYLTKAKV
jgi:hypothetical protein